MEYDLVLHNEKNTLQRLATITKGPLPRRGEHIRHENIGYQLKVKDVIYHTSKLTSRVSYIEVIVKRE